jgi:hypothetical protein
MAEYPPEVQALVEAVGEHAKNPSIATETEILRAYSVLNTAQYRPERGPRDRWYVKAMYLWNNNRQMGHLWADEGKLAEQVASLLNEHDRRLAGAGPQNWSKAGDKCMLVEFPDHKSRDSAAMFMGITKTADPALSALHEAEERGARWALEAEGWHTSWYLDTRSKNICREARAREGR